MGRKFNFTIQLNLVVKKNSRPIFRNKKTGKVFIGKSKKLSDFEQVAGLLLKSQKSAQGISNPLSGPIRINMIRFEHAKSQRKDTDNIITTLFDLLQDAGIIQNDKQIKHIRNVFNLENMGKDQTYIEFEEIDSAPVVSDGNSLSSFLKSVKAKIEK